MRRRREYHQKYADFLATGKSYNRESDLVRRAKQDFGHCFEAVTIYAKTFNWIPEMEMNEYQCLLTRNFFPYAVRLIFRRYWGKYSEIISKIYKFTAEDVEAYLLATVTTRQQGKTVWMTLNAIALALSAGTVGPDDFDQGFASQRKDLSVESLGNLKKRLESVPYFQANFKAGRWLTAVVEIERIGKTDSFKNRMVAVSKVSIITHHTTLIACT